MFYKGYSLFLTSNSGYDNTFLEEFSDSKPGGISSVAFSQNNQWLVSGNWYGEVRLWNLRPGPIVLRGHKHRVTTLAFSPSSPSPNAKILVSGSFDDTTRLWELSDRDGVFISPKNLKAPKNGNVNSVAFSPDGQIVASGNLAGDVRLWDISNRDQVLQILSDPGQEISSVAFSPPDGKIIAAGSHSTKVLLWNLSNPNQPRPLSSLEGHRDKVKAVAFSPPDGKILASGDENRIVRLWNWEQVNAKPIILPEFDGGISSIAFSPEPFKEFQMLAVATHRQTIELWDISPLQKSLEAEPIFLKEYSHFQGSRVTFSPDGLFLASGSYDGKVRLWNLEQPQANPIVLEGHKKAVKALAFSPDGEWLATGSQDNTIRIWIAKTEKIANMVCEKVWRNLTFKEWKEFVGEGISYECTCPNLPPGEGVPASGQTNTSRNGSELQLREDKLMPKQKKLLNVIKDATAQKPDLSEEEIAKALDDTKTKLDEVESITLDALCQQGFITKTDNEEGNIKYSLSPPDRK